MTKKERQILENMKRNSVESNRAAREVSQGYHGLSRENVLTIWKQMIDALLK
jgi:hypothetical protein